MIRRGGLRDVAEGYGGDFALNINAVHQRPRYFIHVPLYHSWCADTVVGGVAIVAAGTGIAAGYEHEGAGIFYRIFGAADGDVAIFERLTEHFEGGFVELREFVAKEYTIVGQRDFSWLRIAAAAYQSYL